MLIDFIQAKKEVIACPRIIYSQNEYFNSLADEKSLEME